MNVRRKLFFTIAMFILGMWLAFVLLTQVIVSNIIEYRFIADRSKELEALSSVFVDFYNQQGRSWEGVRVVNIDNSKLNIREDSSFMLVSHEQQILYFKGEAEYNLVRSLGVRGNIRVDNETVAYLYYYDVDAANITIVSRGVRSTVTFMLLTGAFVFMLISLLVAYWLSKKLTNPLTILTSAISRLGNGEYGVQASVNSKDEYETVSNAFNEMSGQLQRAEEVRRNLVADVAHELRTPITIIRGKLDLLQQEGRPVEPESMLPLQDELIRLTRLVGDLHQLSLAESRKIILEKEQTDLAELLARIIHRVTPDAEDKDIDIRLVNQSKTARVYVDPMRITQVFLNLLINAIRYTPKGGSVNITIDEVVSKEAGKNMLRISITDTGTGIEPEHLPFVFNRFYRTDEARTRNSGGMGLGLAIAKEFVLAHKGTIEVDSRVGHGTTFTVRIPLM